jgi:hypothetical protein
MGGGSQPQGASPVESARASAMGTTAGMAMGLANEPLASYSRLYSEAMMGPQYQQLQSGLSARAGLQSALAARDIASQADPGAFAQREARLAAANTRLSRLYGQDVGAFATFRAPQVYRVPTTAELPTAREVGRAGRQIGRRIVYPTISSSGRVRLKGSS